MSLLPLKGLNQALLMVASEIEKVGIDSSDISFEMSDLKLTCPPLCTVSVKNRTSDGSESDG